MAEAPVKDARPGAGLWLALKASFTTAPGITSWTAVCALLLAVEPVVFALVTAHLVGSLPAAIAAGGTGPEASRVYALLIFASALFGAGRILPTI
ncbi:MAG: hypothetical protein ABIO67_05855, partial [Mycobacteriales bacterium]